MSVGLKVLVDGHVKADTAHSPCGVYTTKSVEDCSTYNMGCVVEVSNSGRVLSVAETNSLHHRMVPEGFVAVKHRSVKEYIHNPLIPLQCSDWALCRAPA